MSLKLSRRAFAIPQEFFNPTRVRYPQRRVGEKGSGQWKRISWEEAYKEAAERFTKIGEEHGWHTIAHQYGTGREIDADFARELSEEFSFESPDGDLAQALAALRAGLASLDDGGLEMLAVDFDRVFFGMGPLTASGFYGALADFTIVFIRADIQPIAEMLGQDA